MKRKLIALAMAALCVTAPLFVYASEEEGMVHLDTEYGVYDLLGCDFFTHDDDNVIVVFSNYENTTDENTSPGMEYYIKAFQDGVNLDGYYMVSSYYDADGTEWENAKSSGTELQPGGSIVYYEAFKLTSDSDVDIEVSALWDWDDDYDTGSYTFQCGEAVASNAASSDEDAEDYEAMYNELLKKYEELEEEYEQLKEDYEALTNE